MNPEEYELMFRVELSHWWYSGMQTITKTLLDQYYTATPRLKILDAGCGTGAAMTSYLKKYGTVTGLDISRIALDFCRARGAERLGCASVSDLPLASSSFDLVTSFDVLYERSVSDDAAALREFARVLVRKGRLLLRLPAYNWLRGRHDRMVQTARRYVQSQVRSMLETSEFEVEHISYANMILFPFALIKRMAERVSGRQDPVSDLSFSPGRLNALLRRTLSLEAPLIARYSLPYGLSVVAIARKK